MAISIDVTPKLDTTTMTITLKLSIARSLLETAISLLDIDAQATHYVNSGIEAIDIRLRDGDSH